MGYRLLVVAVVWHVAIHFTAEVSMMQLQCATTPV